jgi:hypothetical protein
MQWQQPQNICLLLMVRVEFLFYFLSNTEDALKTQQPQRVPCRHCYSWHGKQGPTTGSSRPWQAPRLRPATLASAARGWLPESSRSSPLLRLSSHRPPAFPPGENCAPATTARDDNSRVPSARRPHPPPSSSSGAGGLAPPPRHGRSATLRAPPPPPRPAGRRLPPSGR